MVMVCVEKTAMAEAEIVVEYTQVAKLCMNVVIEGVVDYRTLLISDFPAREQKHKLRLTRGLCETRYTYNETDEHHVRAKILKRLLKNAQKDGKTAVGHADLYYYGKDETDSENMFYGCLRMADEECKFNPREQHMKANKGECFFDVQRFVDYAVYLLYTTEDHDGLEILKGLTLKPKQRVAGRRGGGGKRKGYDPRWEEKAIKPSHRGKFTEYLHRHGRPGGVSMDDIQWAKHHAKETGNTTLFREAQFAQNVRH